MWVISWLLTDSNVTHREETIWNYINVLFLVTPGDLILTELIHSFLFAHDGGSYSCGFVCDSLHTVFVPLCLLQKFLEITSWSWKPLWKPTQPTPHDCYRNKSSMCCCVSIQKVINTVIPCLDCWVTSIFRGVLKLQDFF